MALRSQGIGRHGSLSPGLESPPPLGAIPAVATSALTTHCQIWFTLIPQTSGVLSLWNQGEPWKGWPVKDENASRNFYGKSLASAWMALITSRFREASTLGRHTHLRSFASQSPCPAQSPICGFSESVGITALESHEWVRIESNWASHFPRFFLRFRQTTGVLSLPSDKTFGSKRTHSSGDMQAGSPHHNRGVFCHNPGHHFESHPRSMAPVCDFPYCGAAGLGAFTGFGLGCGAALRSR